MSVSPTSPSLERVDGGASSLTNRGRVLMLVTAFLGWFCAGFLLSITSVAMQPAAIDLLSRNEQLNRERYAELTTLSKSAGVKSGETKLSDDQQRELEQGNVIVGSWVAWLKCAFLFGAAFGGLCFGALGDRFGRTKGMGLAILTYGGMAGLAYFSQTPVHLLICWFIACMGVGGMWPNGVALVAEAWASLSRTASAGIIGAAANIGIFLMSSLMKYHPPVPAGTGASAESVWSTLTHFGKPIPTDWRWALLFAAIPSVLGFVSLLAVPESPRWLASRGKSKTDSGATLGTREIFKPPYLRITLIGIAVATVPINGGWGAADWMVQWADRAGADNPELKAQVNQYRAMTGIVGSLLGGWVASVVGRKLTYFLVSVVALFISQYTFWYVVPTDPSFLTWVGALGLFSGIYFGWLPFCLPELFPTRARSAGAGVCFNFGRILTAVTVLTTGALMGFFKGDYAQIGRATSLIFAVGMVLIWFTPDTSQKQLED